jgi:hypothetical protein
MAFGKGRTRDIKTSSLKGFHEAENLSNGFGTLVNFPILDGFCPSLITQGCGCPE